MVDIENRDHLEFDLDVDGVLIGIIHYGQFPFKGDGGSAKNDH